MSNAIPSSKENKQKKSLYKSRNKSNLEYILMVLPAMLLILVFSYLPMGGLVVAFKNYRYDLGIFGSEWVGFENFKFFFESQDAWVVTRNTVGMNLLFLIVGTFFCLLVAILMYEISNHIFIKIYQTTMFLPHFLSWVVVGFMTYALFNPAYGIVNKVLTSLNLEPIDVYFSPEYWPFILLAVSIWKGTGWGSLLYYAALMNIDKEQIEAAKIDGANRWQVTTRIIIPYLVPVMIIILILSVGNIFRADFGMFYQLPRNISLLYPTTDVIDTYVYRALRVTGNIGMSSAVGFYQSIVGFVLVLGTNLIVRKIDKESALF